MERHGVLEEAAGAHIVPLHPCDHAKVKARMAEKVLTSRIVEGCIVAVKGFGLCKECGGLVVVPLSDVDPTKKTACRRGAKGIVAPLPPGKALRQLRGGTFRPAADVGQHPAECEGPGPRSG